MLIWPNSENCLKMIEMEKQKKKILVDMHLQIIAMSIKYHFRQFIWRDWNINRHSRNSDSCNAYHS